VEASYKFGPKTTREDARRVLHDVFLWVALLLLFVFAGGGTIEAANLMSRPAVSVGPGSQFAIADFDGDGHPDLASVQAQGNSAANAYWIEVQLSSVGREFLRLAAPTGGLQIEARDVNGDHTVDLVIFTALFRQPVAIFLNDGHGNFSREAPSAFPEAFGQTNEKFASSVRSEAGAAVALPSSRDRICLEARELSQNGSIVASIATSNSPHVFRRFLISRADRAPPSETLHP
jgi:hypothetical protein